MEKEEVRKDSNGNDVVSCKFCEKDTTATSIKKCSMCYESVKGIDVINRTPKLKEHVLKELNAVEIGKATEKPEDDRFTNGFGLAISYLVRGHGDTGIAESLIRECGFSKKDFSKCDDFDLEIINKLDIK